MAEIRKLRPVIALMFSLCWLSPASSVMARGTSSMAENQQIPPNPAPLQEVGKELDCRDMVADAERRHRIPGQMLTAITIAESGRWMADRKVFIAWPWTVYAEGKGRYFETKAAAVAAVQTLLKAGGRNIDVGCMQVNLHYHPDAFANLDMALEPAANIEYAAKLLRKLYEQRKSWYQAVALYHSATKTLNQPYRRKVIGLWHKERRRANVKRRRLIQAAVEQRQIARRSRLGRIK